MLSATLKSCLTESGLRATLLVTRHLLQDRTACERTSEIDSAEGFSNETLKPTTARLARSMASVSHGRPIDHHYVHERVIDLDDIHREVRA